jgi:hypothetical protein
MLIIEYDSFRIRMEADLKLRWICHRARVLQLALAESHFVLVFLVDSKRIGRSMKVVIFSAD